jgi:cell division protease FtsH
VANGDDDGREIGRWWLPLGGLLLVALLLVVTQVAWTTRTTTTWSELKDLVERDQIEEVAFDGEWLVKARRKNPSEAQPEVLQVVRVKDDEGFLELLEQKGVPYHAVQPNPCSTGSVSLVMLLPLVVVGLFWLFVSRQSGPTRGVAAFGRSTASMAPEEGTGVTFADVAGVDEAAEELQEVIAFLRTPDKFTALGGRPPKGVLLVGPPGTGKTLLARAVAGEAGVPFFSISGSAFVEMFVGVGAARVRDLFKNAVEHAPCIIFIDELDAVGKARGAAGPAGNEEREQTLNQLLVEMDGFDNRKGIIVMAATNRPEILDPALLRAGRFDRQVLVDRPDVRGRTMILEVHARKLKLGKDVDPSEIAKLTPGFAGADLANVLNEAALLAARRNHLAIERQDVEDAIEREIAGLEKKNRRLNEREKKTVAYHECGHAICAAASPGADPVKKISIIPRGIGALGYTIQLPLEDRYLMAKSELLNRITILYGGRAAEEIVFGDVTTGAHDDIRKATDLARRMVIEYGMSPAVGAVDYSGETRANPFGVGPTHTGFTDASPETAQTIEREIHRFLDGCHQRAVQILLDNRVVLEEMTQQLLEREVLDGDDMGAWLARVQLAAELGDPPTGELAAQG